ncbi:hypothetical protein SFC50_04460 [Bacillus infantis]|uniref:hypothetical protein n=1 Tax=Bacillus infantis TaxID=324767 RepID=UPI0039822CC5
MALVEKINQLPKWSRKQSNRWADFIELSCLKNKDYYFSIDDMLDHYSDEEPEEMDRGSRDHSSKYDKIRLEIENYFLIIAYREKTLGKHYPFEIDETGSAITLKKHLKKYNIYYLFLLFASNLSFFDKPTIHELTHAFEDISCDILKLISPSLAVTRVFGTSRNENERVFYKGNLRSRITTLAANLNTNTSDAFNDDPKYDKPGGDAGLDLVSFIPIDDMPFIPVSFAQCSCSQDEWENKQFSIKRDIWDRRISNIAPYLEFLFVPFYYRRVNGEFENKTTIYTSLIDRHRIFKIARRSIFKKFEKHNIYTKTMQIIEELRSCN